MLLQNLLIFAFKKWPNGSKTAQLLENGQISLEMPTNTRLANTYISLDNFSAESQKNIVKAQFDKAMRRFETFETNVYDVNSVRFNEKLNLIKSVANNKKLTYDDLLNELAYREQLLLAIFENLKTKEYESKLTIEQLIIDFFEQGGSEHCRSWPKFGDNENYNIYQDEDGCLYKTKAIVSKAINAFDLPEKISDKLPLATNRLTVRGQNLNIVSLNTVLKYYQHL